MSSKSAVKETCIQSACFFLPFFRSGEWRRRGQSPWKGIKKKKEIDVDFLRSLAVYTEDRMQRSADVMSFLLELHDDWAITPAKDGVWMETETMIYEDILPKLQEGGFSPDDFELYTEYTRKWGML